MAIVVATNSLHTSPIHSTPRDNVSNGIGDGMMEFEAKSDCLFGPSSPENQLGLPENRNWFGHPYKARSSSCQSSIPKDNSDIELKADIVPEKCNVNISTINPSEEKVCKATHIF
ncbi:hypothetical protein BDZ94DRAFT_1314663 [Collybia nuda]|uniref:Uncharacterized protein n=1 Tax=Collybia nuda TaxID=64659 RepID=A0A9P5XU80_9AGAR|nr:hypothetical protein BDZ94DRAFT_1314663 [Collybia nuda]